MDQQELICRFKNSTAKRMKIADTRQAAGMPILLHGPMFAAGPQNLSNPLVRQLLTAKRELLVPDGNTRPVTLQSRAAVYTRNSKEFTALMIQPNRNEGIIYLGVYSDKKAGLYFLPSEMVPLSPKLADDFTYARNVAMVCKLYSSTRSATNALIQGTLDAVSLFDYRDLTSSSRASIMKAAPGDNSYVVGVPANLGVTITTGPEAIPDNFNQPLSPTTRDDAGNDLKYDYFAYRTVPESLKSWSAGNPIKMLDLTVDDGSLVPNLIDAPIKIQGCMSADADFVVLFRVTCESAAKGKAGKEFALWDYFASQEDKLTPGTGGPYQGVSFSVEYSPQILSKAAVLDDEPIDFPYIIKKVELQVGQFQDIGGISGKLHWSVGSMSIPGYFNTINGPTSIILLNGFEDECSTACGQAIEIQVSQLVEATPAGQLNQYIDPSTSLQRFSDSSMLSLALVAFNTGADGIRRAWVGSAYNDFVKDIVEGNKTVASVVSTLQAAGPLGEVGRHLGGLIGGLPIIGPLAKPALGWIGDQLDSTLFSAGMPQHSMSGSGRVGYAAGPEGSTAAETSPDPPISPTGQSGEDETEAADELASRVALREHSYMEAISSDTYGRGPIGQYQYAMKLLHKNRIQATLDDNGTTAQEVCDTLCNSYRDCVPILESCGAPHPMVMRVRGALAKGVVDTIRMCMQKNPMHSSPEAMGILEEPALKERLRIGYCAGADFSPVGFGAITFTPMPIVPANQVAPTDVMAEVDNNFMGALQTILAGKNQYPPSGNWARYAYFPVVEMAGNNEITGSIETVIICNRPVQDQSLAGQVTNARYGLTRVAITNATGAVTNYSLNVENSFLPNNVTSPTKEELDCIRALFTGCLFTGVPTGSFISCPAFDKVTGPSIGLAVAAAALNLNHDVAYTGGLATNGYPTPVLVTEVGYLPSKIGAAGQVNKLLICPNQADAIQLLNDDQNNNGIIASTADILAGKVNKTVAAITVSTLTDTILASASLKLARKEKGEVSDQIKEEQRALATEQEALARQYTQGDPGLTTRQWQVPTPGGGFANVPLFDPGWWRERSRFFGADPKLIRVTPATIQNHMEHGAFKRLLGLATQVVARERKEMRGGGGGGPVTPLSRIGARVRLRRTNILQPNRPSTSRRNRPLERGAWDWGGLVRGPQQAQQAQQLPAPEEEDVDFEEATDNLHF